MVSLVLSTFGRRLAMRAGRSAYATDSIPTQMRAAVLKDFGDAKNIVVEQVPVPSPGSQEFLIKVLASSLNSIDCEMRRGYGKSVLWSNSGPHKILGRDCVGTIVKAGSSVFQFKVGDKVACALDPRQRGCHAEFVSIKETQLALCPSNLSNYEATSIPYAALTGYRAAVDIAEIKPFSRVFINGGSGAIGTYLIQLLKSKRYNCHVSATAGSSNQQELISMGVDIPLNYSDPNYANKFEAVDTVIDTFGGFENENLLIPKTKSGGTYVSLRGPILPALDKVGIPLGVLQAGGTIAFRTAKALAGRGVHLRYGLVQPRGQWLKEIMSEYGSGLVKAKIDARIFGLDEISSAHDHFDQKKARGKVIIDCTK